MTCTVPENYRFWSSKEDTIDFQRCLRNEVHTLRDDFDTLRNEVHTLRDDFDTLRKKGLATTSDLEKKTSCTQIINGIHNCSIPKYDTIVEPNDFKLGSVIDSSENVCLHFKNVPDVIGTAAAKYRAHSFGHGDIPDNYVCVDAAKTTQYFKALVPEAMQPEVKGALDMVSVSDIIKDR